ncbi:MAG: SPOR domain-containing protein [Rhodothermia bacterium]|nr:SPOR domain-containing protein [Rhodothermia bacterium]
MNDPLPRFRREDVFQTAQIPESDIQSPIPNPAQAAAAVLDALSSDAPEEKVFFSEEHTHSATLAQDLPISGSSAAETIAESVSGFDETLHVAAPEITTEGFIAEIPHNTSEVPVDIRAVDGINRFVYDEAVGDPMDTASFGTPVVLAGTSLPPVIESAASPPPEVLPAPLPEDAKSSMEPSLGIPPIDIDPALLNLGNSLPDELQSPIIDLTKSVADLPDDAPNAGMDSPLMVLDAVSIPIPSEEALNNLADLQELAEAPSEISADAPPSPPKIGSEPVAPPPNDPKQEIAMMLEQDEPAFTVAVRYLETYRQDPTGESGADALFWAAENYQKAGLPGKARGLFQDFVRQFPEHPKVRTAQEYLQWIDVDTPSEEQVTRPTLNTALASQIPVEAKQPAMDVSSYSAPLPNFKPLGDQTAAQGSPTPLPKPASEETYHYVAPPVMGPAMRNPPAQPIPQTLRMAPAVAEQKPLEPVSTESSKATPVATATPVPLLLRAKNFVQSKPPKVRGLIYILSGLALFLIALVLFTLSRGLFSNTNGPTISQTGQTGTTTESLVQPSGTAPAPGTSGGTSLTGTGDDNTATGGSTGLAAGGGNDSTNAEAFKNPIEVQGGGDLNVPAGGWGWSLKFTSNRAELEKMAANLRSRGYRTGILTISSPQQGYRLVLGQFKTKDEAKAAKGKLPYDTPKDAWTVEIK